MELIKWSDKIAIGVREIDNQHKELIGYINALYSAMSEGHGTDILKEILEGLTDYTIKHFSAEERYMLINDYPEYEMHKSAHTDLVVKVKEYKHSFERGDSLVTSELLRFLSDWLLKHIEKTDTRLAAFLKEKGH